MKQKTKSKRSQNIVYIIIERSDDSFSAYALNRAGVYGQGDTVDEAKQSALHGLKLLKKYNKAGSKESADKSSPKIIYKFDTESFLSYYKKIFTNAALERLTGINQKQLQHYSSGLKKPRQAQVKKIETAIHNLGRELMALEL